MSLSIPVLYHWAPTEAREKINRRGLKPTCHTADHRRLVADGVTRAWTIGDSFLAVCLGTSPSHAWSLSGAIMADEGESWDLWQATLDEDDEVHPLPFSGFRLDEIRVANRIPKSRLWLVGSRTVAARKWSVTRAA